LAVRAKQQAGAGGDDQLVLGLLGPLVLGGFGFPKSAAATWAPASISISLVLPDGNFNRRHLYCKTKIINVNKGNIK
jgi:hypothetical protein